MSDDKRSEGKHAVDLSMVELCWLLLPAVSNAKT